MTPEKLTSISGLKGIQSLENAEVKGLSKCCTITVQFSPILYLVTC